MTTPPLPFPGTAPSGRERLDLRAPLPTGTVVLEASAGTGKTYAIAALATRAVAEGRCTLPELLIVTFTRAATAELRDRVRRRLVGAERHLRATLAGRSPDAGDDLVLVHVADADADELATRHRRLVDALTDFDAATIATIHGFTQQVLRSVGLAVDVPRALTLLEDDTTLLDEVTDDVYVRRYLGRADLAERPKRTEVRALARLVAQHPDAEVHPPVAHGQGDGPDDGQDDDAQGPSAADLVASERVACATELRAALAARKRTDGTLSYDDLLHALRAALRDPERGTQARAVLRERYRWALIDEFQDTDPVQWDILADAFRDPDDPHRALVLIGDPKQAIYSFRGADVRAYLAATELADQRLDLATNFRSDGALLGALDRLLAGTTFGEDAIAFAPVDPTPKHADRHVDDDADPAALQLRPYAPPYGRASAPAVRSHIARDLAAVLLDQFGRVGTGDDGRPLRPEDVAVLVRANHEARLVQTTFREVGIPSVVNGVGSVLATRATDDWRWLLDAVERPSDPGRIRRLALSCWVGWRADQLALEDEDALDRLHDDAARWATVLADHGLATLERTVLAEREVARRLLTEVGGERHLTDVRHVGRLLHVAEREEDRGVSSLRGWLLSARTEAGDSPTPSDAQARRLESDARAVQILTVHRSKGLQYPVVCVPFSWSAGLGVTSPLAVHDARVGGRVLDVGPNDRPGFDAVKTIAQREAVGEHLRLLYVAVTRAQHRAIVWFAPTQGSERSALARVLFRGDDDAVVLDGPVSVPDPGDATTARLTGRFAGSSTSVTPVPTDDPLADHTRFGDAVGPRERLRAASFDRRLDRAWRRTSYSGLVRRAERYAEHAGHPADDDAVDSEPEVTGKDDEPRDPTSDATAGTGLPHPMDADRHDRHASPTARSGTHGAEPAGWRDPVPLGPLRGGAAFGTLVHTVLEHTDLASPDLAAEVDRVLTEQLPRHRVPALRSEELPVLVEGLADAIRSPLGPLVEGPTGRPWRLADVSRADRLDELEFELPLAGGDTPHADGAAVTLDRLADLLERPASNGGLDDDDPLRDARYADRLRTPGFALDVRGYLTGSIDLVLRVPGADGQPRYLVADHKTNRLGGEVPTPSDYRPAALVTEMVRHDYPLQALLYQVAVHRFLRWRQPGYDPDVHLGGVLYLFLRGMTGPQTPRNDGHPCGVFAWRPPTAVITDLSDLLDGVVVAPTTADPVQGRP